MVSGATEPAPLAVFTVLALAFIAAAVYVSGPRVLLAVIAGLTAAAVTPHAE